MKVTEEMLATARHLQGQYESRVEMIWDEMVLDVLERAYDLTTDEAAELVDMS